MSQNNNPGDQAQITVPYDQFHLAALLGWVEANGYKPHVLINTRHKGVQLPPHCMTKDREIINLHSAACGKQTWADDQLTVYTRFGGQEFKLVIPYQSVLAVNFHGTANWVPMPWAALVDADGDESVQITAVEEPVAVTEQMVAASGEVTTIPPERLNNVTQVDFAARRKKTT